MSSRLFFPLIFLAVLGPSPRAFAASRCLDVIAWRGDSEDVSVVRETLGGGVLATQAAATCQGVGISVAFSNGRWTFILRRNEEKATHSGPDLQVAATWVESQLVPPVGIAIPAPPVKKEESPKPPAAPGIGASSGGWPLMAIVFSGAALTQDYQGAGIDAELDLRLGRLWSGISVGYVLMPEQSGVRRDQMALQVLAGSRIDWSRLRLLPGVAVGIGAMELAGSNVEGDDVPRSATRTDLLFSLFLRAQFALTGRIQLLLDLSARISPVNLSTKVFGGSEDENTGGETEKMFKANIADEAGLGTSKLVFLIRLGLAWRWSGW